MDENYYITLVYKELKGSINSDEKSELQNWSNSSEQNKLLKEEIEMTWELSSSDTDSVIELDVEKDLLKVKQKLFTAKENANTPVATPKTRKLSRFIYAIAAALAIVIGANMWLNLNSTVTSFIATNGNEEFSLSDGTLVFLTEGSRLDWYKNYGQESREVRLEGEGFFDVKHNPDKTFRISAGQTEISVLGTSFNVKADNDKVTVMVKTGKVRLANNYSDLILTKNQTGQHLYNQNALVLSDYPTRNADAKRSSKVSFLDLPLTQVVEEVVYLYGKTLIIDNDKLKDCKVTLLVNSANFEKLVKKITETLNMSTEVVDSNTIRLLNGSCQ